MSVVILLVVAHIVRPNLPSNVDLNFAPIFQIAALSVSVLAVWLRRRVFSEQNLLKLLSLMPRDKSAMESSTYFKYASESKKSDLRKLELAELKILLASKRLTPWRFILFALYDGIAIFGFITAYVQTDISLMYPFIGIALLFLILDFPRLETVVERMFKLEKRASLGI